MLAGAMDELKIGEPRLLSTDIGPVIDGRTPRRSSTRTPRADKEARLIKVAKLGEDCAHGTFFAPRAYEIALARPAAARSLRSGAARAALEGERAGAGDRRHQRHRLRPHPRRAQPHRLHHRDDLARRQGGELLRQPNQIGAVVGVQPFGGEGLSGTGPKAGGPHYLARFVTERTLTINTTAAGGNASLLTLGEWGRGRAPGRGRRRRRISRRAPRRAPVRDGWERCARGLPPAGGGAQVQPAPRTACSTCAIRWPAARPQGLRARVQPSPRTWAAWATSRRTAPPACSMLIGTQLIEAARAAGVQRYFFASSACVYPAARQDRADLPPLRGRTPIRPIPRTAMAGRSSSASACADISSRTTASTRAWRACTTSTARSAPGAAGAKAPAALCRKVLEARTQAEPSIEIWGDGTQSRSFLRG